MKTLVFFVLFCVLAVSQANGDIHSNRSDMNSGSANGSDVEWGKYDSMSDFVEESTAEELKYGIHPKLFPNHSSFGSAWSQQNTRNISFEEVPTVTRPQDCSTPECFKDARIDRLTPLRPKYANLNPIGPSQPAAPMIAHHLHATHLIDPLFLIATLAFVTFLINSILGLVTDLTSATPIRRTRFAHEATHSNHQKEINGILQHAFDVYEQRNRF